MIRALLVATFACASLCVSAEAATIVVGSADRGGNCIPFGGCSYISSHDQQLYDNSFFSGAVSITALDFYVSDTGSSPVSDGNFQISLSTTSRFPLTLDTQNFDNNLGSDNQLVFSGDLPSLVDGVLTLRLTTPFSYNPLKGNLLLDVEVDGETLLSSMFFQSSSDSGLARLIYNNTIQRSELDTSYGLVTGFETGDVVSPVPLPASAPMLGAALLGLGALGYGMKRRSLPQAA